MKKGNWIWIGMMALSLLGFTGIGSSYAQTGELLRVAFPGDARSFDPGITTRDYTGYAVISGIYDFLVQYDKKPNKDGTLTVDTTKVIPMLAEKWEHNPDMSEWTFSLRKDAKFHSGKPVNAQAVKYTFSRYIKIKNAANTVLWLAKVTEQGMEVLDDYTIKFKLQGPNPLLLDYFQMLNLGIQDPEAIDANGGIVAEKPNDWVSKNDVGSGPFKLVSWKPGVEVVMERNENYWGTKPKSKRVVFKIIPEDSTREMLLTKGEIDIMWLPPTKDYEMLNKRKNLKVLGVPSIRSTYIDMNRNMPPFDNIVIRKALCYSFPYESVIKNVLHGRAVQMTSPVPKGAPSHTSEYFPFKYDLNKAKGLLKEAGYPNGFSFTFPLGEGRIANDKEIAVVWQAELKKIGITMTIDVIPQAAFLEKLKAKNVPIFMISWTSFVTDPFYQLLFLLGSKSFANYADIKDSKLDEWIDKAVPEGNKEKRYAISKEVQKYAADQALWVYMFQPMMDTAMNKKVQGFCFNPDDQFHVRTVFVEK
jgi:peptide/nickel transport system substrate-binding protein